MPLAGAIIKASDTPSLLYRRKAAAESVTSSTTFQNDDDFVIPLTAGAWRVEIMASVTGAVGGDLRIQWTFSGTAAVSRTSFGPGGGTSDANNSAFAHMMALAYTSPGVYGTDGSNASAIYEDLLCEVTVAGDLVMTWAQSASSATPTTFGSSSRAYLTPVTVF